MNVLLNYSSLPSSERVSPRIGAFNTLLDDENGALTRYSTKASVRCLVALAAAVYKFQVCTQKTQYGPCSTAGMRLCT